VTVQACLSVLREGLGHRGAGGEGLPTGGALGEAGEVEEPLRHLA
jgi:hypothetical protein